MSQSGFYRAFEERYRGSRELIRSRLEAYRPFIEPLAQVYPAAKTIDLGCGRGEWLELMQDCGFTAHGVDIDREMLAACNERGLSVTKGDAIEYLKILGAQTQAIVSGFHIAEHIPFKKLETLVINALRVLKPGGLLILETPNPENIQVGTCNFYLDPTHTRPIPPLLLAFIPEHYGYARTRIVRLQEEEGTVQRIRLALMDVLDGVSPDYAVIAQKSAAPAVLESFDSAFAMPYGIELSELAGRYNHMLHIGMEQADQRLNACEAQGEQVLQVLESTRQEALQVAMQAQQAQQQAEERSTQSHSRIVELETALATTRQELNEIHRVNHHHWQLAEARQRATVALQESLSNAETALAATESALVATETALVTAQNELSAAHHANHHHWLLAEQRQQRIDALLKSISWRITAPLRFIMLVLVIYPLRGLRSFTNFILKHIIEIAQRPLSWLMAKVLEQRRFSDQLNNWLLRRYPTLHGQLLDIARRNGLMPTASPQPAKKHSPNYDAAAPIDTTDTTNAAPIMAADDDPQLQALPQHVRAIYLDLHSALTQQNEHGDKP